MLLTLVEDKILHSLENRAIKVVVLAVVRIVGDVTEIWRGKNSLEAKPDSAQKAVGIHCKALLSVSLVKYQFLKRWEL